MTADRCPQVGERWLFDKLWKNANRKVAVLVDEVTDDGMVKHHSVDSGRPLEPRTVATFVATYSIDPEQPSRVVPMVRPPATDVPADPVEIPHVAGDDDAPELPLAVPA